LSIRQRFTSQCLHHRLAQIGGTRPNTEIDSLCELGSRDEERNILAGGSSMRLLRITTVVAGDEQQIAKSQLTQQFRQTPIEILERRSGPFRVRVNHFQPDENESAWNFVEQAAHFVDDVPPPGHCSRPGQSAAAEQISDFSDADQDLTRTIQHVQHRQARRLSGKIPTTWTDLQFLESAVNGCATIRWIPQGSLKAFLASRQR